MKRKYMILGVFVALALIISYIETMLPLSFAVPGIKLGLSNIVILMVLYSLGEKEAFFISIVRIILTGFLFGTMSGILYGLSGGLLSFLVMSLLKRTTIFSMIGVSVAGGVFHNIGQLIMAIVVVENFFVVFYLPTLLVVGTITGLLIGMVAKEVNKRLPRDFAK